VYSVCVCVCVFTLHQNPMFGLANPFAGTVSHQAGHTTFIAGIVDLAACMIIGENLGWGWLVDLDSPYHCFL